LKAHTSRSGFFACAWGIKLRRTHTHGFADEVNKLLSLVGF
jgi:hypothetical protein